MGFIRIPGIDISDADAAVAEVAATKTFYSIAQPKKTGTMLTVSLDPTSSAYPQGYHAGNPGGLVAVDPDLNSFNILDGIEIFGVHGTAGYFNPYYAENLKATKALALKVAADKSIAKNAALTRALKYTLIDDPTDFIMLLTPTLAGPKSLTMLAAADKSISKNAAIQRESGLQTLVDGYDYEHPLSTIVDETAAAQSGTPDDMDLAYAAVNDASYFCGVYKSNRVWLNISTAGIGNWSLTLEYWNGANWVAVVGEIDHTSQFMTGGLHFIQHTPQVDWATSTINSITGYWLRYRVTAFVNVTTPPKGAQSWVETLL